ncbi:uncharacterized protein LOC124593764 [Schistocerca americana]|uniref:uncharacterized protein LOC124593764 n=1 Tax=Schistocerca americana TaxID=7009 RepID=UPI001F4F3745|nr:uncharacterized protein LOC124593764 [Schistocerca americana]XP_047105867.1 uncharacterized protein LOC124775095 [Schistocerca piceifrons]XP_049948822.1 uncharacterized protein LOC126456932 [Schistocerca serialis cubense]
MLSNITHCFWLMFILLVLFVPAGEAIRCYQCSSAEDLKGEDNCGAYKKFDKSRHIAVDCGSDESHVLGTFCVKKTQQGPKGFIWDGRWRQVIRQCASVATYGVTGVCNWGVYDNGVYWEECYCSEDGCNLAPSSKISKPLLMILSTVALLTYMWLQ